MLPKALLTSVLIFNCLLVVPLGTTYAQATAEDKIEYYIAKKDWDSLVKLGRLSVPRLIAALRDDDATVRTGAIEALGKIGDKGSAASLTAVMKNDKSESVRYSAAQALDKLGYAPENLADKVLFLVVKGEKEKLGKLGSDAVAPLVAIMRDMKGKEQYGNAATAAEVLGLIRDSKASVALIAVADGSDYVGSGYINVAPKHPLTCAAVTSLGNIGDAKAVDHIIALIGRIRSIDEHSDIWAACARSLGQLGDKRAIGALGELLNRDKTKGNFASYQYLTFYWNDVCDALVRFGNQSVQPLITALKNENPLIRARASSALGDIGDRGAVPSLCAALEDGDKKVQFSAMDALGTIKDERAITPLLKKLKDPDSGVRNRAAEILDILGWKP